MNKFYKLDCKFKYTNFLNTALYSLCSLQSVICL